MKTVGVRKCERWCSTTTRFLLILPAASLCRRRQSEVRTAVRSLKRHRSPVGFLCASELCFGREELTVIDVLQGSSAAVLHADPQFVPAGNKPEKRSETYSLPKT